MRTAWLSLVVVTFVVGVWLAARQYGGGVLNPERALQDRSAGATPQAAMSPASETAAPPGNTGNGDDDRNVAAAGTTPANPSIPAPNRTVEPESPNTAELAAGPMIRNALTGFLVDDGLSASDSARIVEEALEGIAECRTRFPDSDADRLTCDRTVQQETGTYQAFRRLSLEVFDRFSSEPGRLP